MDETEIIKRVIETGKVNIGSRSVSRSIDKAKLVILAANCPKKIRQRIESAKAPLYVYNGSSLALGEVCRKPFPIAAMAVMDPGQADITPLVKEARS